MLNSDAHKRTMPYVPTRIASKELGRLAPLSGSMLKKTKFNISKTKQDNDNTSVESYAKETSSVKTILYCRVSSKKQRPDLERQAEYLLDRFPGAEIIKDIGSGLNYKRKGLKAIWSLSLLRHKLQVVVAYRDRLCRFGFELIEFIEKPMPVEKSWFSTIRLAPQKQNSQKICYPSYMSSAVGCTENVVIAKY